MKTLTTLSPLAFAAVLASCAPTAADNQSASEPGTLISQSAVESEGLIPGAASGANFEYVSTNGIDGESAITVTGATVRLTGSTLGIPASFSLGRTNGSASNNDARDGWLR